LLRTNRIRILYSISFEEGFVPSQISLIKFLSIEPLIAPIADLDLTSINWVIVGGESGPKARPIKKEWVDYIHYQCKAYNVPFFFKQWGKPQFNHDSSDPTISKDHPMHAKGGCQLNGNIYKEMPIETSL